MTDCSRCTTASGGPTWEGPCPFKDARVRPSPCADLTTEDNRTPIVEGMRLWNDYDNWWGTVRDIDRRDGWFYLDSGAGRRTLLNGARVRTAPRPQ